MKKRDESGDKQLEEKLAKFRKEVADCLKSHPKYDILFKDKLIKEELLKEDLSDKERMAVKNFQNFTTYFTNFYTVRKNLYSDEEKFSTVAFRLVNENLPRFLDNYEIFQQISKEPLDFSVLQQTMLEQYFIVGIEPVFDVDGYNYCMTQKGIDIYNKIVGEINGLVNLQIQQNGKKLPKLKVLYKQLLVEGGKNFEIEAFSSDAEVMDAIQHSSERIQRVLSTIDEAEMQSFTDALVESAGKGIFVKTDVSLTALSQIVTGEWNAFSEALSSKYDAEYSGKKKYGTEKYDEEKSKELKKVKSYQLSSLQEVVSVHCVNIIEKYTRYIEDCMKEIELAYEGMKQKVYVQHDSSRKLSKNLEAVESIKGYLDALKNLEAKIKIIGGTGLEAERNIYFYSEYDSVLGHFQKLDDLYNKVRNYITKKPFTTEKCKINFNRATFLNGWDKNKERDNLGILMCKGNDYYLAVMDCANSGIIEKAPEATTGEVYHKMEYKMLPGPNKNLPRVFFAKKNIDKYQPSEELLKKYEEGTHIKGSNFSIEDCRNLIDFYKRSIQLTEDWAVFDFQFSDTESYQDISGFYQEVEDQGYKINFRDIDAEYIDHLVETGKLYLFRIYNKDFSEYKRIDLHGDSGAGRKASVYR